MLARSTQLEALDLWITSGWPRPVETATRVVTVEIQGLRYPIRSELDEQYVIELARYVDAKMARAGHEVPTGESLKIAVLAALNIADELFRCRGRARRARRSWCGARTISSGSSTAAVDRLHA